MAGATGATGDTIVGNTQRVTGTGLTFQWGQQPLTKKPRSDTDGFREAREGDVMEMALEEGVRMGKPSGTVTFGVRPTI